MGYYVPLVVVVGPENKELVTYLTSRKSGVLC